MKDIEWDVQRLRLQLDEKCSAFDVVTTARAEGLHPLLKFFTITSDNETTPEGMVLPEDCLGVIMAVDFSAENVPHLDFIKEPDFLGFEFNYSDGTNVKLPICTLISLDVFESRELMTEYMEGDEPDEVELIYGIEYGEGSTWDGPQDFRKLTMDKCIEILEKAYSNATDPEVTINFTQEGEVRGSQSEVMFESADLSEALKNAIYLSSGNGVLN